MFRRSDSDPEEGGAGWRAATYSIFVDRAIGLIALAVVIAAALPWSYRLISDTHGWMALLLLDLAALAAGFGFLLIGALPWPWLKQWWATHHVHACAVIANRVLFSREHGLRVATLSIAIHVVTVVIGWCVVKSITAPVTFGQIFQLLPPVMLINATAMTTIAMVESMKTLRRAIPAVGSGNARLRDVRPVKTVVSKILVSQLSRAIRMAVMAMTTTVMGAPMKAIYVQMARCV